MEPTRPADAQPATCIEVSILWGSSVLHVAHLSPPRSFYLGEAESSAGACDAFVPAAAIGASCAPLLLAGTGGALSLVILPGAEGTIDRPAQGRCSIAEAIAEAEPIAAIPGAFAIPFPDGARARIAIGGLSIAVTSSAAPPAIAGLRRTDKRSVPFLVGSAIVQVGLLAVSSCFPASPQADDLDGVSADQLYAIQAELADADEKVMADKETEQTAENTADTKEGGTGARARGEEGSMGNPTTRATSNRYGVQGPPDLHLSREQSMRDAAEFGMIGLLNQGAGGDPNEPGGGWGSAGAIGGVPGLPDASAGRGIAGSGVAGLALGGGGTGARGIPIAAPIAAPVAAPLAAQPAIHADAAIDPNGRFATTYRPGGGHLAAFESAVASGVIPAAAREVVSDVGARYTPAIDVPAGHALAMRADLERGALPPSGGAVHLRVALRSSAEHAAERPHLSVHLVLDVSGSMAGDSITRARGAADALVDKLAPGDDFSLVTFSNDADLRVPDGPVGSRRGFIHQVIQGIHEEGGTNIGAGLSLGYAQASLPGIPEDAVRVVLLLSDGHANAGITASDRLSRLALDAFQHGIQTSSFGLGSDYDGALMSSIAADGAGGYYYLRDPDQIAPALATELDRRLDPVATAVEVRVRLKPDVDLLRVYGSQRLSEAEAQRVRTLEVAADAQAQKRDRIAQDRQDDAEGGMRFFMPAFARDDGHAMLFQLRVPAGAGGRAIAGIELKYKDRIAHKNVIEEIPIKTAYANGDAESAATADASVARTVQGFAAGEALTEAAVKIARGDRDGAGALLAEREAILRTAAETLREPLFLRDADRLARLRGSSETRTGMGDPLVLAMLLETAGRAHMR
jgi:Ca-activated chloride channel homolog